MNFFPKILLCCPINEVKKYCIEDWLVHVRNLTYPSVDYFFCDNSKTKEFSECVNRLGFNCHWLNPDGKTNIQYMAESHEACRRYAIENNIDYMFHYECDIFCEYLDIIERLLNHNKPVVSGMYHIRNGSDSHLMIQDGYCDEIGVYSRNLDEGSDVLIIDGNLKKVYSAGLGCCLISRKVFEKIKFSYKSFLNVHPDSIFAMDLFENKIPQYIDTAIICQHRNSVWLNY